jgi:hypothetical protein
VQTPSLAAISGVAVKRLANPLACSRAHAPMQWQRKELLVLLASIERHDMA